MASSFVLQSQLEVPDIIMRTHVDTPYQRVVWGQARQDRATQS
jgi:hypothetical protein